MKPKKLQPAKSLFPPPEKEDEHSYASTMDVASTSKRCRETPEKTMNEKKTKGTTEEHLNEMQLDAILNAIDSLGKRLDDRMEDMHSQMQQHSTMLTSIARTVQLNSEDLKRMQSSS